MNGNTEIQNESVESIGRFLAFLVGKEEFAIPLLSVREVIALPKITPVPFTPKHFIGIMNIRGQVISVVDLRVKLNIDSAVNKQTSIIILESNGIVIGVVVDSIDRVLSIPKENIQPTPEIESKVGTQYIQGVYNTEEKMILLVDLMRILDSNDLKLIEKQKAAA